jgi:hypothetical protein
MSQKTGTKQERKRRGVKTKDDKKPNQKRRKGNKTLSQKSEILVNHMTNILDKNISYHTAVNISVPTLSSDITCLILTGDRTFGVITKLDLMDKGTNAVDV